MQESSTKGMNHPSVLRFRQDLETQLRQHVREAIETVLEAELTSALRSARHERTERREGYRHGALQRTITTGDGLRELEVPRGRIRQEDGTTKEFRSQLLPRYARRTRDVDAAILGSYLAGTNSRRIRTALKPLLGERHLSKSAVSRIVARLKALFTTWQARNLSGERYAVLFLDGFHLKVLRRVREEADDALSSRGTIDRRGRLRSPHLLQLSEGDVEVVAHHEHARKPQPRIPATNEDASVVRDRGGGADVALRFGRVRPNRIASHRRPRTVTRLSGEGMVSGRLTVSSGQPLTGAR
ncbi:MAG: hypothetical protein EHM89_15030 [Acidobacteria bacterium]|nr:MAG: hypothetical protein EHM89_15030 [Acidobacteriota bacterium]